MRVTLPQDKMNKSKVKVQLVAKHLCNQRSQYGVYQSVNRPLFADLYDNIIRHGYESSTIYSYPRDADTF